MSYVVGVLNEGEFFLVEIYMVVCGEDEMWLIVVFEIVGVFFEIFLVVDVLVLLWDEMFCRLDMLFLYEVLDVSLNFSIDVIMCGKIDEVLWMFLGLGLKKYKVWFVLDGVVFWLLKVRLGMKIFDYIYVGIEFILVFRGVYQDIMGLYGEVSF